MNQPKTLAWHETMELHELVALQSTFLYKLKKNVKMIREEELRALYVISIQALEKNIKELIMFYPAAPGMEELRISEEEVFLASDLLGTAKVAVRNYAIAITETATPMLREVLTRHLVAAIKWHEQVFLYTYKKGIYPSYDLQQLLMNDLKLANAALAEEY
ncbi:spore coat protein [Bacillus sp. M6-12]|uniref:spore coat protein n=1 Tax=Bacillus sp. M6-12 TaxID=2054166 RepID=UPI000C768983|nr:spore coat protein [Bacillus sp. M6-12]PLS16758.1 spore coat protein [Bacillus sp. M6-12]